MDHTLTLSPQPATDRWIGLCSCGWVTHVNLYDVPEDKLGVARLWTLGELRRRHALHVDYTAEDEPDGH